MTWQMNSIVSMLAAIVHNRRSSKISVETNEGTTTVVVPADLLEEFNNHAIEVQYDRYQALYTFIIRGKVT